MNEQAGFFKRIGKLFKGGNKATAELPDINAEERGDNGSAHTSTAAVASFSRKDCRSYAAETRSTMGTSSHPGSPGGPWTRPLSISRVTGTEERALPTVSRALKPRSTQQS